MAVFEKSDAKILSDAFTQALLDHGIAKSSETDNGLKDPNKENKNKSVGVPTRNDQKAVAGEMEKAQNKFIEFMKLPAKVVKAYNESISAVAANADPVLKQVNELQKHYGGLNIDLDKAAGSSEAVVKRLFAMQEAYYNVGNAGTEMSKSLGQAGNILSLYFDDEAEAFNRSEEVLGHLVEQHSQFVNQLDEQTLTKLPFYSEALGISSADVASNIERQINRTGTANTTMLDDIAKFSQGLAKTTGIPLKSISANAVKITNDTKRLGSVTAEEATRIAATLGQLGQDYDSFSGALDKFQEFGSSAETSGLISQITGGAVNLDAQQLMYLASEEQEKFLPELRRSLLAGGVTKEVFESYSNAEQNQLAQALSMNKENVMSLLDTSRAFNEADLIDAQAEIEADPADGFDAVLAQMELAPKAFNDASDTAEYYRTKSLVPLRKELLLNAEAQSTLNATLRDNVEITGEDAIIKSHKATLQVQREVTDKAANAIKPGTELDEAGLSKVYKSVTDHNPDGVIKPLEPTDTMFAVDANESTQTQDQRPTASPNPVPPPPQQVAQPTASFPEEQSAANQVIEEYNLGKLAQDDESNNKIIAKLSELIEAFKSQLKRKPKEIVVNIDGQVLGQAVIDGEYITSGTTTKIVTTA